MQMTSAEVSLLSKLLPCPSSRFLEIKSAIDLGTGPVGEDGDARKLYTSMLIKMMKKKNDMNLELIFSEVSSFKELLIVLECEMNPEFFMHS